MSTAFNPASDAHYAGQELEQVAVTGHGLSDALATVNRDTAHMNAVQLQAYKDLVNKQVGDNKLLPELALIYAKDKQQTGMASTSDGITSDDLYTYQQTHKLNFLETQMVDNLRNNYGSLRNASDSWSHPLQATSDLVTGHDAISVTDIDSQLQPMIDASAYKLGAEDAVSQLNSNPDQPDSLFRKLSFGADKITPNTLNQAMQEDQHSRQGTGTPYLTDAQQSAAQFVQKHYDDIAVVQFDQLGDELPGDIGPEDLDRFSREKLGKPALEVASSVSDSGPTALKGREFAEKHPDPELPRGEGHADADPYRESAAARDTENPSIDGFSEAQNAAFRKLAKMSAQDANQGPWSVACRLLGDSDPSVMQLTHQLKQQYQQDTGDASDAINTLTAGYQHLTPDNFQKMLDQSSALRNRFNQLTKDTDDSSIDV